MYITERTIKSVGRFKAFKYRMVMEGVAIGIFTGLLIVAFRLSVSHIEESISILRNLAVQKPLFAPVLACLLFFLATAITFLVKTEPMISGSGIPQVKAELQGYLNLNWWRVLLCKFAGCVLALGGGMSLGREGPSVQLGGMVGKGFSRITKRNKAEERFLITCGAGAGLTAAFNAPIAGAVFCLEEMHHSFSEKTLLTAMASTISADFTASYVFGLKPIFSLKVDNIMPLKYYWTILILGLVLGVCGAAFNKILGFFQDLYKKPAVNRFKIFLPFAVIFLLEFVYPDAVGGGTHLVESASSGDMTATALCVLFIVKFTLFMLCFGSGAPGGIFMPMLVFGAILGSIWGQGAGISPDFGNMYAETFVIAGMAGFFTAVVRAPVTGIILISEMTGSLSHLLALSLVSLAAYFASDLMKARPVYDQLLRRLLKQAKEI